MFCMNTSVGHQAMKSLANRPRKEDEIQNHMSKPYKAASSLVVEFSYSGVSTIEAIKEALGYEAKNSSAIIEYPDVGVHNVERYDFSNPKADKSKTSIASVICEVSGQWIENLQPATEMIIKMTLYPGGEVSDPTTPD